MGTYRKLVHACKQSLRKGERQATNFRQTLVNKGLLEDGRPGFFVFCFLHNESQLATLINEHQWWWW